MGDGDFAFLWEDTQSTATAYTDATATEAGQTYRYSVTALRGSDKSDWSVEVSATLPQVTVTWIAPLGLTPAELPNTLLGYSESEGVGTLEPNEVTIDDESFRVTNVSAWPGVAGLALFLTAGTSAENAALVGTDFVLEADEYVLIVGTTEFSFDDVTLAHSDTTGEGGEYTGVVTAGWTDGEPALTAGETVAFRLERRDRPEPAQLQEMPSQDFNTLSAAGNDEPYGIWSDGTTMWVADSDDAKIYAYKMSDMSRDSGKDFNTLSAAGNNEPRDIWSDGTTMWVMDQVDRMIYAYDMTTKARKPGEDFDNLHTKYEELISGPTSISTHTGIWSVGQTMWVLDAANQATPIRGYDMDTKAETGENFGSVLWADGARVPRCAWSDGTTVWVTNSGTGTTVTKVFAYWLDTKYPDPNRRIEVASGNQDPRGLWSDGTTMWVSDLVDAKLYAYGVPPASDPPDASNLVTVDRIASTTARVNIHMERNPYSFPPETLLYGIEVYLTISYDGREIVMEVTPEDSTISVLMDGLHPETTYAVSATFYLFLLDEVTFTTAHPKVSNIVVTHVAPNWATEGLPEGRGHRVPDRLRAVQEEQRQRCAQQLVIRGLQDLLRLRRVRADRHGGAHRLRRAGVLGRKLPIHFSQQSPIRPQGRDLAGKVQRPHHPLLHGARVGGDDDRRRGLAR